MKMEDLLRELNVGDIKATDEHGNTALHLAVKNNTFTQKKIIEILETLLDKNMNLNTKNKQNQTALHLAVAHRMKDVVNFLRAHRIEMNSVAHFFIENEYMTFQELLANKNDLDEWYDGILRMENESSSFVEWLISRGFDFDWKNGESKSALYMAIEHNLQHLLPVLLKCTKDISSIYDGNKTLLHLFLTRNSESRQSEPNSVDENWYSGRYAAAIVKILLDRRVSADAEDMKKCTPVQLAIMEQEDISVIEILLDHCANVQHRDIDNETTFQMVIRLFFSSTRQSEREYYLKVMRSLAAKGADVNEPNAPVKYGYTHGYTPLCCAVNDRNTQLIDFLEENGADFSVTTNNGYNLLHLLLDPVPKMIEVDDKVKLSIINLIISKGCQVNAKDANGNTPLHKAIKCNCLALVQKLVQHGAEVNCKNNDDVTPLHVAAMMRCHLSIVEVLLRNGADFRMVTKKGETLLHLFTKSGTTKANEDAEMALFDLFTSQGCQVDARDIFGNTPLHEAVDRDDVATVRKLVDHGAEVNCKSKHGVTPVEIAVIRRGNLQVVELLSENGADFTATTKDGETLLHALINERYALTLGEEKCFSRVLNLLIDGGCRVNTKDENGTSPIHLAARYTSAAVVRMLIERDVDVNCRNNQMETPLHFSVTNCMAMNEIIELLVDRGANVNAKDSKGLTALHKVTREIGSVDTLRTLLKCGADVNAKDADGHSVLSCASSLDCHVYNIEMHGAYAYRFYENEVWNMEPNSDKEAALIKLLARHSIKLKAVSLPWDRKINDRLGDSIVEGGVEIDGEKYSKDCLEEVKTLKSTFIDSRTSLYTLLHTNLNSRRAYIYNEKLQQLVQSPKLEEKFPEYSVLILASYHEAVTRESLSKPAKEAWMELTKVSLPEECIELILSFLSNADLFDMIREN